MDLVTGEGRAWDEYYDRIRAREYMELLSRRVDLNDFAPKYTNYQEREDIEEELRARFERRYPKPNQMDLGDSKANNWNRKNFEEWLNRRDDYVQAVVPWKIKRTLRGKTENGD